MVTALYRLNLTPPLSLLSQLDDLLTGRIHEEVPEDLRDHPGIQRLRCLRWPTASRAGLIALLLRTVLLDEWRPPTGTNSADLRDALDEALHDEEIPPRPEPFPGVLLRQAADGIDARVLTLLDMLGPDAVRDDPGLPLRLLPKAAALPPFARAQRRLLTADLRRDDDGRAQGQAWGAGLAGIQRRGKPDALLPSQLALPPDVLAMRHLRGDLLYRAQTGGEPPRLRPTVILLDVSPPTFGPVEKVTRLAAMLVGRTLLDAGLPAMLVTAGGRSCFQVLDRRSQLLSCWTERSLEPARPAETLRAAEKLRETLRGGPLEPVVLLLSHAWFGAEDDPKPQSAVRALLVRYPGQSEVEPLGRRYGRLAMVGSDESESLPRVLRELIG